MGVLAHVIDREKITGVYAYVNDWKIKEEETALV